MWSTLPFCFAAFATFCATVVHAANAPKVTRADFLAIFQRDVVASISLAPDGQHLAFVTRDRGGDSLNIANVNRPLPRTSLRVRGVKSVDWVNAGTVAYALASELRAVDVDGKNDRKLVDGMELAIYDIDPEGGSVKTSKPYPRPPEVLGVLPGSSGVLALSGAARLPGIANGPAGAVQAYLYDVPNAKLTRLETRMGGVGRALLDQQGHFSLYRSEQQVVSYRQAGATFWQNIDGVVGDGTGGLHFTGSDKEYFGEHSLPLAFGPDGTQVYFASNVGRDKYGIFALDLGTRKQTGFALEDPAQDLATPSDSLSRNVLIFDREGELVGVRRPDGTAGWLKPELAALEQQLGDRFKGRRVQLLDWTPTRDRALFLASSASDPGRYYTYTAASNRLAEFLRRSDGMPVEKTGVSTPFAFTTADGVHLTGTLTQPRNAALTPPPLAVYCHDFPMAISGDAYSPDAQALAAIGFVVLEVNHRGTPGFGQQHLRAMLDGPDRIPLEDIRAAIAWVESRQKLDSNRIALVGEGMGGFVAIRALELFPEQFRCAITINAPADLGDWLYGSGAIGGTPVDERAKDLIASAPNVSSYSAIGDASRITKPVLILQEPGWGGTVARHGERLRDAIRKGPADATLVSLVHGFKARDPGARASGYLEIADFLRASIYDFNVKVGPLQAK